MNIRRILPTLSALSLVVGAQATAQPSARSDIEQGRTVYVAKGCYQCHGRIGQGASGVGARLAPPRLAVDAFAAYVRRPTGVMPAYSANLLPEEEVRAIHAYLRSLPPARSAASIAMLNPFLTPAARQSVSASPPGGEAVYRQHCAACHGAEMEGGAAAPSLVGEGAKRTLSQTAALIRQPPPKMPKLFPSPVSEADVQAVAAYLHRPTR